MRLSLRKHLIFLNAHNKHAQRILLNVIGFLLPLHEAPETQKNYKTKVGKK